MEVVVDRSQAIKAVQEYAMNKYPAYPTASLIAREFELGWVVFPESDPANLESLRIGQRVFVIGRNGHIMESSSSLPPGEAEAAFVTLYG